MSENGVSKKGGLSPPKTAERKLGPCTQAEETQCRRLGGHHFVMTPGHKIPEKGSSHEIPHVCDRCGCGAISDRIVSGKGLEALRAEQRLTNEAPCPRNKGGDL